MREMDQVPAEPKSSDEAGESTGVAGDNRVAQERGHQSDASGTAVDDPARGEKRLRQRREGATEITEMD